MRRLFWMTGGLGLAALAATQCGYPSFDFSPLPSSSSSGSSGGMAGTGGMGDSASTTSTGTMTAACRLTHDAEDCPPGDRCTVISLNTGKTGCVPVASQTRKLYEDCADDSVCPAGAWCDLRTLVCMPFCEALSDCTAGDCVPARNVNGKLIASVCTANCNPTSASPCAGKTNCVYDSMLGDFDCFKSQGNMEFDSCAVSTDCGHGLVCADDGTGGLCVRWCHPVDTSPSVCAGGTCTAFTNLTPQWMNETYGYCN
jgi:hypothetical protein